MDLRVVSKTLVKNYREGETDNAPNSSTSSQLQSILLDREDRSPGTSVL